MRKNFFIFASALTALSAAAANPGIPEGEIFRLDAPAEVPVAVQYANADEIILEHEKMWGTPTRAQALNPYDLNGRYVNMYCNLNVSAIAAMDYTENVIVTQDGTNVYIEGVAGFGEEALIDNPYYSFESPIKGTIDRATGKISIKGGQVVAGIKGATGDLKKIIVFPCSSPGYISMTNGTDVWAHLENGKIVWDKHILFCPAGGAFGFGVPVSNGPVASVYKCRMAPINGAISYSAVVDDTTYDYNSPAWYEYVTRDDATYLRMSNVMLQSGYGFVTEWKVDGDLAVAESQPTWYDGSNFYYLWSYTSRGQYVKKVGADISNRQHVTWPVKFDNNKIVNWVVKTNNGDPTFTNSMGTLTGMWYENYPTLYLLNDDCDWDYAAPIEVVSPEGKYEFELAPGVTDFRLSLTKGSSAVDEAGYLLGAFCLAEEGDVQIGETRSLVNGDGFITVADFDEPRTVNVDLDLMTISVSIPYVESVEVYFDNSTKAWNNPVAFYSKDNAATWHGPVAMNRYYELTLDAPARVPDYQGDGSEELWVVEIPETATHVKFADADSETDTTSAYPAAANLVYTDQGTLTGIDAVKAAQAIPAVYYNLQGIRVDRPEAGAVYIKIQDGRVDKVVF